MGKKDTLKNLAALLFLMLFFINSIITLNAQPVMDGIYDPEEGWGEAVASNPDEGFAGANAQNLFVTSDETYIYFGAQIVAGEWMSWGFAINASGSGGIHDEVWTYPISYGHVPKPDYVVKGHFGNYAELRVWDGDEGHNLDMVLGENDKGISTSFVEVRILRSKLENPDNISVQFYLSGDNEEEHATFDAVPQDEVADSWNTSTTLENYAADIDVFYDGEPVDPDEFPVTFTVTNIDPEVTSVYIKGTFNAWTDVLMTNTEGNTWSSSFEMQAGNYEWGVSDQDLNWLPPENLVFSIDNEGNITGTVTFTIEEGSGPDTEIGWVNLQHPESGETAPESEFLVYARVFIDGITGLEATTETLEDLSAWIGYSSTDATDDADFEGADWTWIEADLSTYEEGFGNDSQYFTDIGSGIDTEGTYYYVSRFKWDEDDFVYGGYNESGGNFWDGTDNVSGVLTVEEESDPEIGWVNLQHPESGEIAPESEFLVYARVFIDGITGSEATTETLEDLSAWIGYSSTDATDDADFEGADWTWIEADLSTYEEGFGNDSQYFTDIGSGIDTEGTYYYVSRFKWDEDDFVYGGYSESGGNFWDGTNNVSGVLTVEEEPDPEIGWVNLQHPEFGEIAPESEFLVYARVFIDGITGSEATVETLEDLSAWIGYSSTDATDDADFEGAGWTWIMADLSTYEEGFENNSQYYADIGSGIDTEDTYYYVSRFKWDEDDFVYGGYNESGGNFWDGTNNVSGVLTVEEEPDPEIGWVNLQHPEFGEIAPESEFLVYARVFIDGITGSEATAETLEDLSAWIGYSSTDATDDADFEGAGWTWIEADLSTYEEGFENNSQYFTDIGSGIDTEGTYYYVSRFKWDEDDFVYGGYNESGGNFWDGNDYVSGVLNVEIPGPNFGIRDEDGEKLPEITYWHTELPGDVTEKGFDFDGNDFGEIEEFFIKGASIKTWKQDGADVHSAFFHYKVWKQTDDEPEDFNTIEVEWTSGNAEDGWDEGIEGNQTWADFGNEINIASGLAKGLYYLKIKFSIEGSGIPGKTEDGPFVAEFEMPFLSSSAEILAFELAEEAQSAIINSDNAEVIAEVLFGTDISQLTPSITISAGATINPPGGTELDFTHGVIYDVTAEDGVTVKTWSVSVTVADEVIDPDILWANLQFPDGGNIEPESEFNVYAQVLIDDLTGESGDETTLENLSAWIGYSTTDATDLADFESADWTWIEADLNNYEDSFGHNSQYSADIGSGIEDEGTYYYVSRFKMGDYDYVYGGYNDGFWDGENNVSGILTVEIDLGPEILWANLQFPDSGNIEPESEFNVYAQVLIDDLTGELGDETTLENLSAWIGYSSTDATDVSDFEGADWTWIEADLNNYEDDFGSNSQYSADLGSGIENEGTYYYVSRFKMGDYDYVYGGYNDGFWDGINNTSGVLVVELPGPNFGIRDDEGVNLPTITYWHTDAADDITERGVDFDGNNLGDIEELYIKGASIKTWTAEGGDVTSAYFHYKVWETGTTEPDTYITRELGWTSDDPEIETNQTWADFGDEINVLDGLPEAAYNIKILFSINGTGIPGTTEDGPHSAVFEKVEGPAPGDPEILFANLQSPGQATIEIGESVDVLAQVVVYPEPDEEEIDPVTGIEHLQAWIGYNDSDTDPSTWTNWVPASFNGVSEYTNRAEYIAAIGDDIDDEGVFYYASRFQYHDLPYKYGGFSDDGGGFWDGDDYVSGILTVVDDSIDEFPVNFTVINENIDVTEVYIKGSFNDWTDVLMTNTEGNTWEASFDIEAGTYEWGVSDQELEWLIEGDNLEFTIDNEGNITGTVSYTIPPSVGIYSLTKVEPTLYPNPANDFVIIDIDYNNVKSVNILDVSGRLLINKQIHSKEDLRMSLSGYRQGFYFVEIILKDGRFVLPLVINN